MRPNPKKIAFLITVVLVLLTPVIIFYSRSPVLIVTEEIFIPLYGTARTKLESRSAARSLFRPVKSVVVADDAGEDIIPFAIAGVSSRPHCVLFPLRFARSARLYKEQNPNVPIIILEGRFREETNSSHSIIGSASDYYIYKTDIDADFHIAGLAAVFFQISAEQNRNEEDDEENHDPIANKIAVFLENETRRQGREAFLQAINSQVIDDFQGRPPQANFYTAYSQFTMTNDISCAVIAGTGNEFFDNNPGVPVIFFTWLDPLIIPDDVVLVLDDSPWAQVVEAVRMADEGVRQGKIPSKLRFINSKIIDRKSLHNMRKKV